LRGDGTDPSTLSSDWEHSTVEMASSSLAVASCDLRLASERRNTRPQLPRRAPTWSRDHAFIIRKESPVSRAVRAWLALRARIARVARTAGIGDDPNAPDPSKVTSTASRCSNGRCTGVPASTCFASDPARLLTRQKHSVAAQMGTLSGGKPRSGAQLVIAESSIPQNTIRLSVRSGVDSGRGESGVDQAAGTDKSHMLIGLGIAAVHGGHKAR